MTQDPGTIAATYFRSWEGKDFDTLRGLLADDATFRGPLGTADNADDCMKGLRGMAQLITKIDVKRIVVDGPDVITWFELHTAGAPPCPTANWSHVEDGRITRIRVAFDPRPLLGDAS